MTSRDMQKTIDRILNEPEKHRSKEEAKQNLIACGIFTKEGNVAERYKNIIVKNAAR